MGSKSPILAVMASVQCEGQPTLQGTDRKEQRSVPAPMAPTTMSASSKCLGLRITTQVLDFDSKRLHFNHEMFNLATNDRLATCEQMLVHVDSKAAKSAPIPDSVAAALTAIKQSHSKLPTPPEIGRTMKIKHKN